MTKSVLGLEGKVAIVTGGARNIGREIALGLAGAGCKVGIADLRQKEAQATAEAIRRGGSEALAVETDICDPEKVGGMVDQVARRFGRVDILINNAAWMEAVRYSVEDIPLPQWDRMQDSTLRGAFLCMRSVVPWMRRAGGGRIVNISSVVFWLGMGGCADYVAAKAGVVGLTRSAARDLGKWKINVNAVTPGAVKTPQEKKIATANDLKKIVDAQCLKRRILPADIARAVLFLSSDLSAGVTGQTLNVDAGWAMH
jgi:3-oxoacyl-[acyl-carrier protein] reductase